MKDYTKDDGSRPELSPLEAIEHCLKCLLADKTKYLNEYVVDECEYEELIGALLLAKDGLKELKKLEEREEN